MIDAPDRRGGRRQRSYGRAATFVAVHRKRFRWTGESPTAFASGAGVRRSFCGKCGTPVAYENEGYPDEIHLYLASLDAGAERPVPQRHDFRDERVGWVKLSDDLPKH